MPTNTVFVVAERKARPRNSISRGSRRIRKHPTNIHSQHLYRTASAVIEAQRLKTDAAAMIVHSFSPERTWFDVFARFAGLCGCSAEPGQLVEVPPPNGMPLFFGWACGDPRFLEA